MEFSTSKQLGRISWTEWLEEHGHKLLLFARQQTRSSADAEDVLQDALVKLARKTSTGAFVGGPEAYLPFLYTQIRREAIDLGRKNDRRRKREETHARDEESLSVNNGLKVFDSGEEQGAILQDRLENLPRKFSEVIMMKIWGNLTFAQIGESLGISLNTAASRYRYGLEALRRNLIEARGRGDL